MVINLFVLLLFFVAGIITLLAMVTGVYYLFKRRKKLHEMSPSNTGFKLNQSQEVDKEYMNK